jgi:hypothetical protein
MIHVGARRFAISLFLLLLLLFSFVSINAQDRVIGHVLELEGEWYLDGRPGQPLSPGNELPAGGVVRIPSPSRYSSIVIIYSANKQAVRKQCRNPGECQQPIILPRAVQRESSLLDSLYEGAMKWLRGSQPIPKPHAGKSSDGKLREAVLEVAGGQVDLAPVFKEMSKGTYYVQLESKIAGTSKTESLRANPIEVKWESGVATMIQSTAINPGVYEIVVLGRSGPEYNPTLTTAWFLVSSAEQYGQAAAQFREVNNSIATWKDVPEETSRVFLRALLIHLAAEQKNTPPSKP